MANLSLDRIMFDPADEADSSNVGSYTRAGSDGDLISSTNTGGKEGLDVNLINASVVVTATDLDIRDLTHVSDSVKVGDGTDFLAVNADGSINVVQGGTFLEDSAHTSGDRGQFILAVRNDNFATTLTSADGDYSPIAVDSKGRIYVVADLDVNSSSEKIEDTAAANADVLNAIAIVRQDALSSSVSADGDYGWGKMDARGALWTAPVGTAADDAADTENPVKVGGKAYTAATALTAVTAGDRTNLASDLYRRIFINDAPNVSVATTLVTVDNTEVALPALAGRTRMIIQNVSNNKVYIGPTGVTTSGATRGLEIGKGNTLTLEAGPGVAYFAIAGTNGNDILVFEQA